MTSGIKQELFTNWHLMRWIGLAIGLFLGFQAFMYQDGLAAMLSVFFLFQAITNTGCFGSRGCSVPQQDTLDDTRDDQFEDIKFTEIKE